jgi:hypothetical protein
MTTVDLTQGPLTIPQIVPVKGDKGDKGDPGQAGPAGMGASTPGGRLTLVSGQPEMPQTADYSSTTLYYAPFESDKIPLFNGTDWVAPSFASGPFDSVGLSMSGGAAWAANTQRDVFVTLVDGLPALCTGPAWPGESMTARGLVRRNGLWVNSAVMSCDVGLVVAAYEATWVGSINIGATAGTLQALFTLGQNRRCDVWNAYNQREVRLGVGCPPPGPTGYVAWKPHNQYPNWQAFNNDLSNSGYYFTGAPTNVECRYIQRGFLDSLNQGYCAMFATVCKDTISNAKGTYGSMSSDTLKDALGVTVEAVFHDRSSVGQHRAIMGTANANQLNGITMWGLEYALGIAPESTHALWISYQG